MNMMRHVSLPVRREKIVQIARSYIGWGWRHQARGPNQIDCVGLPIMIARQLRIVPSDFNVTGYSRRSELHKLVEEFQKHLIERPLPKAEPGDLVVTRDHILPCHCGIIGKERYGLSFIHARASIGRQKSKGMQKQGSVREESYKIWQAKATHCFMFPGAF